MNCIFCKIINKEIPAQIVYENDHIIAFLDIKPVNKGHLLIVPKEHHEDILETKDTILQDIIIHAKRIAKATMTAVKADGFNLAVNTKSAAGQVIFHTHFHIIPRFNNDGLKSWPHHDTTPEELTEVQEEIKKLIQ